jgi:hypothetical protein
MYKHILKSCKAKRRGQKKVTATCQRIAAATVNMHRGRRAALKKGKGRRKSRRKSLKGPCEDAILEARRALAEAETPAQRRAAQKFMAHVTSRCGSTRGLGGESRILSFTPQGVLVDMSTVPVDPLERAVAVEHVPLDRGGYDRYGRYWGRGEKLYRYTTYDGEIDDYLRAPSRQAARATLKSRYPDRKVLRGLDGSPRSQAEWRRFKEEMEAAYRTTGRYPPEAEELYNMPAPRPSARYKVPERLMPPWSKLREVEKRELIDEARIAHAEVGERITKKQALAYARRSWNEWRRQQREERRGGSPSAFTVINEPLEGLGGLSAVSFNTTYGNDACSSEGIVASDRVYRLFNCRNGFEADPGWSVHERILEEGEDGSEVVYDMDEGFDEIAEFLPEQEDAFYAFREKLLALKGVK